MAMWGRLIFWIIFPVVVSVPFYQNWLWRELSPWTETQNQETRKMEHRVKKQKASSNFFFFFFEKKKKYVQMAQIMIYDKIQLQP